MYKGVYFPIYIILIFNTCNRDMVTSYHFGSNKTTSQDIQSRNTAYRLIGICCIDFDFSFLFNLYLLDKDLKGKVSSEAGYPNVCPYQHFHSRKKTAV